MELWIRSQDKEALRRINTSLYLKFGLSNYAEGDVWFIVTGGDNLGEYKTKERSLEVLDEIQNKLKNEDNDLINKLKILENTPIINCSNNDDCETNINIELLKNMIIYEMPED